MRADDDMRRIHWEEEAVLESIRDRNGLPPTDTFSMTLLSGRNNCFYQPTMCHDGTTAFNIRPRVFAWENRRKSYHSTWAGFTTFVFVMEIAWVYCYGHWWIIPIHMFYCGIAARLMISGDETMLCTYCNSVGRNCQVNVAPHQASRNLVTALFLYSRSCQTLSQFVTVQFQLHSEAALETFQP
jgi:hypothetical protein